MSRPVRVVVLGGGPSGLAASLLLGQRPEFEVVLAERNPGVGGNAGSFLLDGLSVDYGSHRLHPSCSPRVMTDIKKMLADDLLERPRYGRIHLLNRWVRFPLKPFNLALGLPPWFMGGILRDSLFKSRSPEGQETFATELQKGLGRTICREFYFPYARKIWGLEPDALDAEQARRRVSANSVLKIIRKILKTVPGFKAPGAGKFFYPRHGFGQISQAYYEAASTAGVDIRLRTSLAEVACENERVSAVGLENGTGVEQREADLLISTIPVTKLVQTMRPAAPQQVVDACNSLRYRAMILIYLVLETEQFTEFDAHYFPSSEISITRLSEPKNYGLAELPGRTVLCAELPCSPEDEVWQADDSQLQELVLNDLARAGLKCHVPVKQVVARRLPQAYPIYERGYRRHFECIDNWVNGVSGLVSIGRQGLFAHDNTHHTLEMAYAACECISSQGALDADRWSDYRAKFETHIVED